MLPTASRLKSHLPKILLRRGRIFCLCPAHTLQPILHQRKEAGKRVKPGSAFCVAKSPERPLAPKSYCATVGFFACALLTPYKPSFTTEKKPGSAFCVARSPERPLAPKSYCATVGFFACALLTPYKPSLTTEKKPGSAFCVARSPERPLAPKSYCATVGFFACALLKPYKPSLATEKKPGSAFCAAKPVKKPTAAKSYYGAVGISLAALPATFLVHICKPRPPTVGVPSLPGWGAGLRLSTQAKKYMYRLESTIAQVFFFWSWVLSCFQGAELSRDPTIHTQSLNFHTHNQVRFPGPEPQ